MIKQVQIWDKVSPINNVPAEKKIVNDWKDVDEVVLILDGNNRVLEINDPAISKSNNKAYRETYMPFFNISLKFYI